MVDVITTVLELCQLVEPGDLFTTPVSGLCPTWFIVTHLDVVLTLVYEYCT